MGVASVCRPQTIADPGFGQDMARAIGIRFQLLAKLADVDAEILDIASASPDFPHDHPMGEHLAGVEYQQPQNVVFLG
jgi:hypothetical protein